MLLPLSDLRDPVSFLRGSRVPLAPKSCGGRWECVNGTIYQFIAGSLEAAEEYDDVADQSVPSRAAIRSLMLDLSDPDIARWCDRKIAAVIIARMRRTYAPIVSAILGVNRKAWVVTTLHEDGRCFSWGFYREESLALRTLDAVPANIPSARAALLRAFFGKETP